MITGFLKNIIYLLIGGVCIVFGKCVSPTDWIDLRSFNRLLVLLWFLLTWPVGVTVIPINLACHFFFLWALLYFCGFLTHCLLVLFGIAILCYWLVLCLHILADVNVKYLLQSFLILWNYCQAVEFERLTEHYLIPKRFSCLVLIIYYYYSCYWLLFPILQLCLRMQLWMETLWALLFWVFWWSFCQWLLPC